MVIIQAPYPQLETATVLPNPEFSDVVNSTNQVEFKRSMNNTKRTYVKTSPRKLLTFNFVLTRAKSLELEAFIKSYYRSLIRLVDHEEVTWVVNFGSNPFEFNGAARAGGVPGNEIVTIPLNFEGVKQ